MQNVLQKEETIVNSTTRSENIQIRDQPIWEIKKNCNVQGVPQLSIHFVLVVFLASSARTDVYFTIFQQPRR